MAAVADPNAKTAVLSAAGAAQIVARAEFRVFGHGIIDIVRSRMWEAHAVLQGVRRMPPETYILSALSDAANVKVRDGLLDIKLKTGTTPQGYELFQPSGKFAFPVKREELAGALSELKVSVDLTEETYPLETVRCWRRRCWRIACSKKRDGLRLGGRYVRLTAAEKAEVIRLVEGPCEADRKACGMPAGRTLARLLHYPLHMADLRAARDAWSAGRSPRAASATPRSSRRCGRCRARRSSRPSSRSSPTRTRRCRSPRADDLAALHRRADDRGARARAQRPRARDRHRLGLRRRGPRPHRTRGLHDRAPRGAGRSSRRARLRDARLSTTCTCLHGDGTLGWAEHAPYDAIVVAAGGPTVPEALLDAARHRRPARDPGRRGPRRCRRSCASPRQADGRIEREDLGDVRFVPLDRRAGLGRRSREPRDGRGRRAPQPPGDASPRLLRESGRAASATSRRRISDALLERIGDARVVCSARRRTAPRSSTACAPGSRAELIQHARLHTSSRSRPTGPTPRASNRYVRGAGRAPMPVGGTPFAALPHLDVAQPRGRTTSSTGCARTTRRRPATQRGRLLRPRSLQPVHLDPRRARLPRPRRSRRRARRPRALRLPDAVAGRSRRLRPRRRDRPLPRLRGRGRRHAARPARAAARVRRRATASASSTRRATRALVANAERYYRAMYYGGDESWNLRDQHMFETLEALLALPRPGREGRRLGAQLARRRRARDRDGRARRAQRRPALPRSASASARTSSASAPITARSPRRTTGTGRCSVMRVRPSHPESYERLCHDAGVPAFLLPLREPARAGGPRRARARRASSARSASSTGPRPSCRATTSTPSLPQQFDEYIWFDETRAVQPVTDAEARGFPRAHPFAPYGRP